MDFIKPLLTSYERPSEINIFDALPATSTGEILKYKLAVSLYAEADASASARPGQCRGQQIRP